MEPDRLKHLLEYDPTTGVFRWLRTAAPKVRGKVAGCPDNHGYLRVRVDGTLYKLHRLAFIYMIGRFPFDNVDHINGKPNDNRWSNLREVSQAQNCRNACRRSDNSSGYVGVGFHAVRNKWRADAKWRGKDIHLGLFDTREEAIAARKAAEPMYVYHENHGRSPNAV